MKKLAKKHYIKFAITSALALAGCNAGDTLEQKLKEAERRLVEGGARVELVCPMDAMNGVKSCSFELKRGASPSIPLPSLPKGLVDVTLVTVQLQTQGATLMSSSGTAAVTLLSGSTSVATGYFAYVVVGNQLQFAQPSSVNSWIDSYDGVDGFDIAAHDLQLASAPGPNSVTIGEKVGANQISSASVSWYQNADGTISPTPPGNL